GPTSGWRSPPTVWPPVSTCRSTRSPSGRDETRAKERSGMGLHGTEERELNVLMEAPDRRVGRRGFLRTTALLGAAGVAGYAGGTGARRGGQGRGRRRAPPRPP